MNNINRRGFLRTGLAGAAGAVTLAPGFSFGTSGKVEKNIISRTLGKTRLKVPVVSFGVMRSDNQALVKAAWENGILLFDTANGYQNGNNELMLGSYFSTLKRDSFLVETKVKPAGASRDGKPTDQTTAEDFLARFETSLSRLKLDYVDILYVHDISTSEMLNHKPLHNALRTLRKKKKIKFTGFSTHANMAAVISEASDMDIWDVILTSYNFRLQNVDEMNTAIRKAATSGIGIVAMKTMAGGYFDKEKTKPVNSTAALKWALTNTDIATAIPGMTTFEQLDSNLKVLEDITLTESEKNDLIASAGEVGLICRSCGSCSGKCPFGLPVQGLMRAYMYAYGYSDIQRAYSLLGELGTGSSPCSHCKDCSIECGGRFNIRERITDISRLVNVPSDFVS